MELKQSRIFLSLIFVFNFKIIYRVKSYRDEGIMIYFLLLFALLGFVFLPVGIIWLIVAFIRKTKKKLPSIILILGILLIGIGVATTEYNDRVNTIQIYSTKINKVYIAKNIVQKDDWLIEGSTKAPNGAKIAVANLNDDSSAGEITKSPIATTAEVKWPKVENGKFRAYIDISEAMGPNEHEAGQSVSLHIVALTNYNKKITSTIPNKMVSTIENDSSAEKFSLTAKQANYLNSLR
ncbi:hypothetical protein [Oenococcus oeni]|nr:hypothetical protein [Oenococcus oeni]